MMEIFRWIALVVLIFFGAYTIYVAWKESFWKSVKAVLALHWGRQVTLDLFVGLFLFSFFIFLNETSAAVAFAWMIAALICGNPVTLIYFVLNFESLIAHFL